MSAVSCSICYETVTSTSVVSYLRCGHVYHQMCVGTWLKKSKTCPECRRAAASTKPIYLNFVVDFEEEQLKAELARKTKEFECLKISIELQNAVTSQLDKKIVLNKTMIDTLQSNTLLLQHKLEMEKRLNCDLNTDVGLLNTELASSLLQIEGMKNSNHHMDELMMVMSEQQSDILSLTERLDLFRSEFVSTNKHLQNSILQSEIIKKERDSLLQKNDQLVREMNSMQLKLNSIDHLSGIPELLEKIKAESNALTESGEFCSTGNNQVELWQRIKNTKNEIDIFEKQSATTNHFPKIT